jgi:hypothetical protein
MDQAFEYAEKYDMITESNYPYTAVDGTCKYKSKTHTTEQVSKFYDVTKDSSG